jgi:hypothetical protein
MKQHDKNVNKREIVTKKAGLKRQFLALRGKSQMKTGFCPQKELGTKNAERDASVSG